MSGHVAKEFKSRFEVRIYLQEINEPNSRILKFTRFDISIT